MKKIITLLTLVTLSLFAAETKYNLILSVQGVKHVADSQLGLMIGLALLLFVFFKYGVEAIVRVWRKRQSK